MPDPVNILTTLSSDVAAAVDRIAPHVVEVRSHRSIASGFIWRDGLVVTADETFAEEGRIDVELSDGRVFAP